MTFCTRYLKTSLVLLSGLMTCVHGLADTNSTQTFQRIINQTIDLDKPYKADINASSVYLNDTIDSRHLSIQKWRTADTLKSPSLATKMAKETKAATTQADAGVSAAEATPPAYNITLGQTYQDTLTADAPEHWYLLSTTQAGKITAMLWNIPKSVDYNLYLFSKAPTETTYVTDAYSLSSNSTQEQLSTTSSPRDYILVVKAIGDVVETPFSIGTLFTNKPDAHEPNDNFWQATTVSPLTAISGTLDSAYDVDYYTFTLATSKKVRFGIQGADYKAILFNSAGQSIGEINKTQSLSGTLPAGTYFWGAAARDSSVIATDTYTITNTQVPARVTLHFKSDEGYTGKVNYGSGNYFTLKESAVLSGQAIDANGDPIAGLKLKFEHHSNADGLPSKIAWATTDASGNYSVTIKSPHDSGSRSRSGARLIYHYDVHAILVGYGDNGTLALPELMMYDKSSTSTTSDSGFLVNDIAYYTYKG